jgi:hypothetical protein
MFHIICSLPNASEEINGIAFQTIEQGDGPDAVNTVQTIDPVEAEVAAQFDGIKGYTVVPLDGELAPLTVVDAAVAAIRDGTELPKRGRGRPPKVRDDASAVQPPTAEETPEPVVEPEAEAAAPAEQAAPVEAAEPDAESPVAPAEVVAAPADAAAEVTAAPAA